MVQKLNIPGRMSLSQLADQLLEQGKIESLSGVVDDLRKIKVGLDIDFSVAIVRGDATYYPLVDIDRIKAVYLGDEYQAKLKQKIKEPLVTDEIKDDKDELDDD